MEENFTNDMIENQSNEQFNDNINEFDIDGINEASQIQESYKEIYPSDNKTETTQNNEIKKGEAVNVQDFANKNIEEKQQQEEAVKEPLQQQLRERLTNIFKVNKNKCDVSQCQEHHDQNTLINQYKDSFVYANTVSLILIMIFIFLYVKNANISKFKNYINDSNIIISFCLLMLSFISSSTNMPTYFINNYKTALYINQACLFITSIIFMITLFKHKSER